MPDGQPEPEAADAQPHAQGDIEFLKIALECAQKEADRMWIRFQTFLLTSSALLAFLSSDFVRAPVNRIVLALSGLVLCVLWLLVTRLSRYYQQRTFGDFTHIIERNGWQNTFAARFGARDKFPRPFGFLSSSHCLYGVIALFAAIWVFFMATAYSSANDNQASAVDFHVHGYVHCNAGSLCMLDDSSPSRQHPTNA